DFELRDVVASDLLEWREALSAGVVAVVRPVTGRRIGEGKEEDSRGEESNRGESKHVPIMARSGARSRRGRRRHRPAGPRRGWRRLEGCTRTRPGWRSPPAFRIV